MFDNIVLHNDKKESTPVFLSYTRTGTGSLFTGDSGNINTGEKLEFEIIAMEELEQQETEIIVNQEKKTTANTTEFEMIFEEEGTQTVFAENEQIICLNQLELNISKFQEFEVNLRIESPEQTLFEGKATVKPVTTIVKENETEEEFYLENSILSPTINALKQEGIEITLSNENGLSIKSVQGITGQGNITWHYLLNQKNIPECPSQQKISPGG